MGATEISENHRRAIAATLSLLDEALSQFEQWAQGRALQSVLYIEHNDLSERQKRMILEQISATRALLTELRSQLGLEPRQRDAGVAIWAAASGLWENLVELGPRYLKGYGEVGPELGNYLQPRVAQIIDHLQRISDAARGVFKDPRRRPDEPPDPEKPA